MTIIVRKYLLNQGFVLKLAEFIVFFFFIILIFDVLTHSFKSSG